MNKSVITNLVSSLFVITAFILPESVYRDYIFQMGVFALSGSITNSIAIYMLFEKVPGLYGSGIIPARFESFKTGIYNLIMNNFFTEENFKKFTDITKAENQLDPNVVIEKLDLNSMFDSIVETIQKSKLGGMLGMFGGGAALEGLRDPFHKEVRFRIEAKLADTEFIGSLIGGHAENGDQRSTYAMMRDKIDLMVMKRLDELTPGMVKDIIQRMIRKHLGWLVVWGGVFGGLIGLVSAFIQQVY